jgi:DNA-binding NtrC family response regulator
LPREWLDAQLSADGLLAPDASGWGTLFLREPARLDMESQRRLNRYLRDRPAHDDRRVVAASARDLRSLAQHGEFLPELLDQLGTLAIEAPPLRERPEDVPVLAQLALEDCNAEGGKQVATIQHSVLQILQGYTWPGNVGQLREVIRVAHARAEGVELRPEDLPLIVQQGTGPGRPTPRAPRPLPLDELLAEAEKRIVQLALRDAGGNVTQAAARLGISVARLSRRLTGLGLRPTSTENLEPGP